MTSKPKGGAAVMAARSEPPDSLDFFPTPPWATRALVERVLPMQMRQLVPSKSLQNCSCWEPAAGEGHMAEVLREYFGVVHASDVHDYGKGYAVGSFIGEGADRAEWTDRLHWAPDFVITNPPFNAAVDFAERALGEAMDGVALLLRSSWLESRERYLRIFAKRPPTIVAFFGERVPMVKGRWDPEASTATSYAWFVWYITEAPPPTQLVWIPPGQRQALERPGDRARFAPAPEPLALFADGNGGAAQ